MNYSDIKYLDTINGDGLRVSLFVSGCNIQCPGCFNKKTWDFNFGNEFTKIEEEKIINTINNDKINYQGLSVLGGEPMNNIIGLNSFIDRVRKECPNKDIWIWSGYTLDYIKNNIELFNFLNKFDMAVLGPFIENQKNLTLRYRGSDNQKIYKINQNLEINDPLRIMETDY